MLYVNFLGLSIVILFCLFIIIFIGLINLIVLTLVLLKGSKTWKIIMSVFVGLKFIGFVAGVLFIAFDVFSVLNLVPGAPPKPCSCNCTTAEWVLLQVDYGVGEDEACEMCCALD